MRDETDGCRVVLFLGCILLAMIFGALTISRGMDPASAVAMFAALVTAKYIF